MAAVCEYPHRMLFSLPDFIYRDSGSREQELKEMSEWLLHRKHIPTEYSDLDFFTRGLDTEALFFVYRPSMRWRKIVSLFSYEDHGYFFTRSSFYAIEEKFSLGYRFCAVADSNAFHKRFSYNKELYTEYACNSYDESDGE